MSQQVVIALDTETFPIGPLQVAPKLVCATVASRDENGIASLLIGNHPDDSLEYFLKTMIRDPNNLIVTHSGAYDYAVICASYPALIPLVFQALLDGRCTDTLWREKLLNLSTTGRLDEIALPDGTSQKIGYSLADLQRQYLGIDRTAEKEDTEDSPRLHFQVHDGWPAREYPENVAKYALDDAIGTLQIYEAQEVRLANSPQASLVTQHFQIAASFALQLMTVHGIEVDPERVAEMRKAVEAKLAACEPALIKMGLLRPSSPARPHARHLERAEGLLEVMNQTVEDAEKLTLETARPLLEQHGIKFTDGKPGSVDTKALQAYVGTLYQQLGEIPKMTAGGSREPQIALDAEVQEYLGERDPLMQLYRDRQALGKIVSNQLPALESGSVIHPNYDALKETGRTSSYGARKGKPALYPTTNIQQVPKEIEDLDPRRCYRPRAGRVFFDVDYTALELACVGQITYDLFGESVHLERYNAGVDLHAYLGAQLAVQVGGGMASEFAEACRAEGLLADPMAVYAAFMECKGAGGEVAAFFKHWRSFAKPVGLGFPGGLGPAKLVTFARQTYDVILTEEQAHEFREVWRATYPEMPQFFKWVEGQTDEYNFDQHGETLHWYETPFGMVRRGATYCAAANGKCMQSPGAEGAKTGVILVQRACYDPTQESVLFGCRPVAFIHDQIVGETTEDSTLWHEQCMEARRILCEAMEKVLPDVKMRSDDAHLTRVWSKKSEPVRDAAGRLVPWEPKVEATK